MVRLYDTYTDEDLIFLIGKKAGSKIKVLLEKDFEITEDIESKYMIFAYSPAYEILNNGYRHLYEKRIEEDLSNIKVIYDDKQEISEIGIEVGKKYIPVYIKYTLDRIKEDINSIIDKCCEYFSGYLIDNYQIESLYKMGLYYFYDGEAIDVNLTIGTEAEKNRLMKENQDVDYLGDYSARISLEEALQHNLDTLILSIAKDELSEDGEVLEYIVNEIDKKLHAIEWKKKINTVDKFSFGSIEQYD